tara:strand:- start:1687 stop:2313 length:627 start_codon:yes stop_codon:yes gene_type:complete
MARKTLLTEGEIRQFMKLADLAPIGTVRLSEMGYDLPGKHDEEDELEDELHATEDELGAEDHMADEEGSELDALEDEPLDMDADAAGGPPETAEELVVDLLTLVQDWASEQGVDMSVDADTGAEEVGVEDEVVVDDELSLGGGEEDESVELEMGAEDELALEGGAPADRQAVVAEVARRVAQRLASENNKQAMVNDLTERIFKRIANS